MIGWQGDAEEDQAAGWVMFLVWGGGERADGVGGRAIRQAARMDSDTQTM